MKRSSATRRLFKGFASRSERSPPSSAASCAVYLQDVSLPIEDKVSDWHRIEDIVARRPRLAGRCRRLAEFLVLALQVGLPRRNWPTSVRRSAAGIASRAWDAGSTGGTAVGRFSLAGTKPRSFAAALLIACLL